MTPNLSFGVHFTWFGSLSHSSSQQFWTSLRSVVNPLWKKTWKFLCCVNKFPYCSVRPTPAGIISTVLGIYHMTVHGFRAIIKSQIPYDGRSTPEEADVKPERTCSTFQPWVWPEFICLTEHAAYLNVRLLYSVYVRLLYSVYHHCLG